MTTLIPKIDFKNGGATPTGAINRTINEKAQETISVKDFGAKGDGSTDDTTALQNALLYLKNLGGGVLTIPSGTYVYTTTLDMTINNLTVRGQGFSSLLKFTGTGNCIKIEGVLGTLGGYTTLDSFAVSGTATATNGIFINNWPKFQLLNISVGNVSGAGIATGFIVFGYMLNPTINEFDWGPSGYTVKPTNGMLLGRPIAGVVTYPDTCALTIVNPNIQGVSGSGLKCVNGFSGVITGGSSEFNTGYGLEVLADFQQTVFTNVDFEGSISGTAALVNGSQNTFIGGLVPSSSQSWVFGAAANQNKVIGGTYGTITLNAGAFLNSLTDVTITANNGLVDNGTSTKLDNALVNSTPQYKYNAAQISNKGFYSQAKSLTAVASGTATTMFTSNSPTFGTWILSAFVPNAGANYVASAIVIDDATQANLTNYDHGSGITFTVSGGHTIQVTQTSGSPQSIVWSVIYMPAV
jgi:hypothetical protein